MARVVPAAVLVAVPVAQAAAPEVDLEAAAVADRFRPEFWQRLLAAELTPEKSRAIIESLGSSIDPIGDLLRSKLLNDAERKRAKDASDPAVFSTGATLLSGDELPPILADSDHTPVACWYWGDREALTKPTIAIVGTRSASAYGRACALKFAEAFAEAGVTVVSGGALGIDAAAHQGVLSANGSTIAVLAGGIEKVYPAVHAGLFLKIRERGGLMSQFAMGSRPNDYKFLVRNGLIAALSQAVLVIEAPARSGAIKTAVEAAELGREVFVVPANIDSITFHGSFNLIRDGATLVDNPYQVLDALGFSIVPKAKVQPPTSDVGSTILAALTSQPTPTEIVVQKTGLDTSTVLSELTLLELDGRVIRDAIGYALRP